MMPPKRSLLAALLVTAAGGAAAASVEPAPAGPAERRADFMRGMVVSCPRHGQIWGTPDMAASLRQLAGLGVEWVSIHPYAGVRRSGEVRYWPAAETGYLERAAAITREQGMKLFWKPHLAYWGSFEWRGAIEFGDDRRAWDAFFDGYEAFIVDQAAFAQEAGAELFAVGVELERTTRFADRWARIIERVRAVYRGTITYAANWDSLDAVPFWDALDLIGVHAYFPLSHRDDPSWDELWRGWDEPLARLEALSARHGGKPTVFAEIGYNRSRSAARAPWDHVIDDTPESRALRRRLTEVALARIESAPSVKGMFWWKWIPGDWRYDRDFSMRNPEALEALAAHWGVSVTGSSSPSPRRGPSSDR